MTHYRYNRQVIPPAPFVYVSVQAPSGESPAIECPAQLDTGADLTVIPSRLVEELRLEQLGELPIFGVEARLVTFPTFLVKLGIREKHAHLIKVLASDQEPYVLLGRDILNRSKITLDGPNLVLEIE